MKNNFLKQALVLAGFALITGSDALAQVSYSAGPGLENDRDSKMNRMLGGDENSFYCYRVRSKGRGTSFFVEKYNKASLKPEFSKEISLGEDEDKTKIEDVEYAAGNVYVFRRHYDKKEDKMSLFFQTISSTGQVSKDLKEVITVTSDHYEFIDFDIYPNAAKTKFVVKATHKSDKKDEYKTDLILIDAVNMKKLDTRRVPQNLHSGGTVTYSFWSGFGSDSYGFIGMYLDEKDNIYYCMTEKVEGGGKSKNRLLNLYTLNAGEKTPKMVNLPFDDDYVVTDIEFSKANDNDIAVGGFLTDVVERKGRDLVRCGIFSFKVKTSNSSITGKTTKFFDDKMLESLESTSKRAKYNNYKLDYILPIGENVYYVGEQYRVTQVSQTSNGRVTNVYYMYEYMDVLVAKLTPKGEFEWIKNVPLRNEMRMDFPHVFKQYIAYNTDKNLYILCDDHPKNMERYEKPDFEPKDLKSVSGIHGSNFVSNAVDLKTGSIKRQMIFKNEDYCFAPIQERNPQFIPPTDCEIFVTGKKNEVYIYTEDRGKDQFGKLTFE